MTDASRNGLEPELKLTEREREVLVLVARGYSTSEIARELWITEETVRTHVRRVLRRLCARTRAHAVAIAFEERLWTCSPAERGGAEM